MGYFKKVKLKDKLYGMVFGAGKVTQVFEDSHYKMMVTFKNGYEIPYTEDGIPGWGNFKKQTIFYKKDIDLDDVDIQPPEKLQVRLPSGIWTDCAKCVRDYAQELLENEQYHLFRKKD